MARAALPGRLNWQQVRVVELITETERTVSLVLEHPQWAGHLPGQHVDVRLTAPDGYQAQRSYSIASAPEDDFMVLTVERLEDGEVSSYLAGELRAGDELELRGPIGGYFVWEPLMVGPVLLVAGGSGIVPFRSMLRHRAVIGSSVAVRLIYSSRSLEDVIYREELMRFGASDDLDVRLVLTREWPPDWQGHRGRIDRQLLDEVAWSSEEQPLIFVCGPTGFVESVADALVQSGHEPDLIRTERFGPTG
jgi:ferredoxin-NADP reductase